MMAAARASPMVTSKVQSQYPRNVEREYIRVVNAYMRLLQAAIKEELPAIREFGQVAPLRSDGVGDSIRGGVDEIFRRIRALFQAKVQRTDLLQSLEKIGNLNRKVAAAQWKRTIKRTLGLDIREDYYMGEFFREQLGKWVNDNVNLIKTIPLDALEEMKSIVLTGYTSGKDPAVIAREIQAAYDMEKRRAQFIARDQTAKLNFDITRAQQTEAGVTKYKWSTSRDGRVRDCHRDLDGQTFAWAEAPENWYDTVKFGRRYVGRYHPGEAPGCRCVALPVFDRQGLRLPLVDVSIGKEWEGGPKTKSRPAA